MAHAAAKLGLDVAEESFERVIVRLGDSERFASRRCIGAALTFHWDHQAVSSRRVRRRIRRR